MAVEKIDSFIFRGIKNLLVFERGTGVLVEDITYLTDITLDVSQTVNYLRGGYKNPKIKPILGKFGN